MTTAPASATAAASTPSTTPASESSAALTPAEGGRRMNFTPIKEGLAGLAAKEGREFLKAYEPVVQFASDGLKACLVGVKKALPWLGGGALGAGLVLAPQITAPILAPVLAPYLVRKSIQFFGAVGAKAEDVLSHVRDTFAAAREGVVEGGKAAREACFEKLATTKLSASFKQEAREVSKLRAPGLSAVAAEALKQTSLQTTSLLNAAKQNDGRVDKGEDTLILGSHRTLKDSILKTCRKFEATLNREEMNGKTPIADKLVTLKEQLTQKIHASRKETEDKLNLGENPTRERAPESLSAAAVLNLFSSDTM